MASSAQNGDNIYELIQGPEPVAATVVTSVKETPCTVRTCMCVCVRVTCKSPQLEC